MAIAICVDPACPDAAFPRHEYGPGCPSFRRMWECAVCRRAEAEHTGPGKPVGYECTGFTPKWTMPSSEKRS